MKSTVLTGRDGGAVFEADIAIVGGGPVGLAIADRCARAGLDAIVLESGVESHGEAHEELNAVGLEDGEDPAKLAAVRSAFHAPQAELWDAYRQAYGVRCRGLGGSTQAWAAKSAPFDPIDFRKRSWVEHSGWPISLEELAPYLADSARILNLCPGEPETRFNSHGLSSFYWQFARSQNNRLDLMRFGRDFAPSLPENVTVLLDATVTGIAFDDESGEVAQLKVASLSGGKVSVRARQYVLAAGAIENARLLLETEAWRPGGRCNPHDTVGRFLIDHGGTRIASAAAQDAEKLGRRFGFFALRHEGRAHMYQHGLALDPADQECDELLNAAIYFAPLRAPDNPWDALARVLKGQSENRLADIATTLRGSGLLLRGAAVRALISPYTPDWMRNAVVESAIRLSPNSVVDEFESAGLPHKLSGMGIQAIIETAPRRTNRITLSDRADAFGRPLPQAHWTAGDVEHRTIRGLANRVKNALQTPELAPFEFAPWVSDPQSAPPQLIDLAHSMGTTRMAQHPGEGVVDPDCRAFGCNNLYLAGGSVFPTGGHANPTWMFLAMGLRLADHIAARCGSA